MSGNRLVLGIYIIFEKSDFFLGSTHLPAPFLKQHWRRSKN